MLEQVLGRARAAILSELYGRPDAELHLRELIRRTDLAPRTVSVEVAHLIALDLLRERRSGMQRYISANTAHPAFSALAELIGVTHIRMALTRAIEADPRIRLGLLFGSAARGQERAHSDIDLLVVGDLELGDLLVLLAPVQERLRREINPVLMSLDEFAARRGVGEHFVTHVLNSKPVLLVGSPDELT
jgi:predicted nucleotidyltransferase